MVFTRHGLIYEKADPAVQTPNQKENPQSLSLSRSRLRRNKNGKYVTPPNSWIARIGEDHHILPRTKISGTSTNPNEAILLNAEIFNIDDPLVIHQPHTELDFTDAVPNGSTVEITVDTCKDSFTVDTSTGVFVRDQIASFINNSPTLSQKIYAISSVNISNRTVHVFSRNLNSYAIAGVGAVPADTNLVAKRPIGTIATVGTDQDPATYNLLTVTPSTSPDAISITDLPEGSVVDSPVYSELMGLFDASRDMEHIEQLNIAPVKGSIGVFIPFLSHYDETLKLDFPKINFTNS